MRNPPLKPYFRPDRPNSLFKLGAFAQATLWAGVAWVMSCGGPSSERKLSSEKRIVTVSPTLTEIVYALGDTVVGRDMLSTLPEHAKLAPEVGYMRSLNDEGILSLKPTHLIATSEAGPEAVLQKIADAGVRLVRTPRLISRDSTVKAIEIVARALNKADSGRKLIANLLAKTDSAARIAASRTDKPRVLYFNTRGDATSLFAHGKQTAADFYITGAGAVNVADFDNVKPLSEEALLAADPDVLLFDQDTFERLGGLEGLSASALFSKLRAVREKRIVVAPTAHFFGVGPHAGELLLNFQRAFRP